MGRKQDYITYKNKKLEKIQGIQFTDIRDVRKFTKGFKLGNIRSSDAIVKSKKRNDGTYEIFVWTKNMENIRGK